MHREQVSRILVYDRVSELEGNGATYTTYVKNQQTYHSHTSGEHAHAISLSSTGIQKSRLNIILFVVEVASIVSTRISRGQKKYVLTKKILKSLIPRVYHGCMLTNIEMVVFLSSTFQPIPISWVLVS